MPTRTDLAQITINAKHDGATHVFVARSRHDHDHHYAIRVFPGDDPRDVIRISRDPLLSASRNVAGRALGGQVTGGGRSGPASPSVGTLAPVSACWRQPGHTRWLVARWLQWPGSAPWLQWRANPADSSYEYYSSQMVSKVGLAWMWTAS